MEREALVTRGLGEFPLVSWVGHSWWDVAVFSGVNLPNSVLLWTLDASPRVGPCHSAISMFIPRAFAGACKALPSLVPGETGSETWSLAVYFLASSSPFP